MGRARGQRLSRRRTLRRRCLRPPCSRQWCRRRAYRRRARRSPSSGRWRSSRCTRMQYGVPGAGPRAANAGRAHRHRGATRPGHGVAAGTVRRAPALANARILRLCDAADQSRDPDSDVDDQAHRVPTALVLTRFGSSPKPSGGESHDHAPSAHTAS